MKRFGRLFGVALLTLVGIALGILAFAWFVDLRQSDAELEAEFKNQRIRPVVRRYTIADGTADRRSIRFMETPGASRTVRSTGVVKAPGDSARPVVLFIHGAPSSLSFFNEFFKDTALLNRAQLVAVDRPGYGYSDFGRVETSVVRQAELLQPLIDRYRNAPYLMIVGSSYGGSVSARLAMNNPGRVDHVVVV